MYPWGMADFMRMPDDRNGIVRIVGIVGLVGLVGLLSKGEKPASIFC
jgi:hypothetical protein